MSAHLKTFNSKLSFLLFLILAACVTSVHAQTIRVFTTSTTFTVPACVTSITVQCWGAGGGGGGASEPSSGACGSGGGGGGFATAVINNASGTYTVTVGSAGLQGIGSASTAANGTAGGNSSVTNGTVTVTATGGGAGTGNTNGEGATVGAGGTGTFVGVTGTTHTGGNGALGNNQDNNTGGAGGGGAGNNGNGVTPAQTGRDANGTGGVGGAGNPNTAQYAGGAGGSVSAAYYEDGGNGSTIGGGGAGGGGEDQFFHGTGSGNGGSGGNGEVIISYTVSTPTITSVTGSGCPGSTVTINGTLLTGATSVTINGVAVTNLSITATSITGTLGAGTTTGTVAVSTPCGTASSATPFTVHPAIAVNLGTQVSCTGSYTFGGQTYTTSGTYSNTTPSTVTGCDSVTTVTLNIGNVVRQSISQTICSDTSVSFGGRTLNTSGTYMDTALSASGCDSITTLNLTVNQSPPAAVTPATATLCPGTDTTLISSSAGFYLWSNGMTTQSITVTPTSSTTYTVTVSNGTGCPGTASAAINVTPFSIRISPDSTDACAGSVNNTTLTCSYFNTNVNGYSWSPNVGTTQGVVVRPSTTTTYSVTVSNTANCSASASAVVVVISSFLTVSPVDTGICGGQSTLLTASGGVSYAWSTGAGSASITVSPTAATSYIVTGTDAAGCTNIDTAVVAVGTTPTTNFTISSPLCQNDNGTVTYTGTSSNAAVYNWNFGGANVTSGTGKGPYQVNWSTTGAQSVSLAITDNGCVGVPDTVNVTVNPSPTADAGADATFCSATSITIGTASTAGDTYLWSPVTGLSSATASNPTVTDTNTTNALVMQTYVVTTTSSNGCTSSDSVVLTVEPAPVAMFTHPAGKCFNTGPFNFTAGGSFLPSATFAWNFGSNSTPPTSTSQNQSVTYSVPQTTDVTLTISQAGCNSLPYTDSVTVYPIPVAAFSAGNTSGCPGVNICFSNNTLDTSAGNTAYLWSFGDGQTSTGMSPCHAYASADSFNVNLQVLANGCANDTTISKYIIINPAPTAKFSASATVVQLPNDEVDFTNLSSNATNYQWNFAGLATSSDINPSYTFADYGIYNVGLLTSNSFGCTDSSTLAIEVLAPQNYFIPNVFTPNNDGNNDRFFIQMQEGVTLLKFNIFDRTGEKVYDGLFPWDGTYKGKPCPEGVYVYFCELELATNSVAVKRSGTVTLLK